jgi:hypothetical protein
MRKAVWLIGMLALAGCVRGGERPGGPVAIEGDSITYSTTACYGRCPIYSVTVRPNGTGVFTGERFTAVTGERAFTLSRAEYDGFAAKLAPYRPVSGEVRYEPGSKNCNLAATDSPSVDVTWRRQIGDSQQLHFYYGCRGEANRAIADALGHAAEGLPIQDMIGPRP